MKTIKKTIGEYVYYIIENNGEKAIVDTVPKDLSAEWIKDSEKAKFLILCDNSPYPESVRTCVESNPSIEVIATSYIRYMIEGICQMKLKGKSVDTGDKISLGGEQINFRLRSIPGEAAVVIGSVAEEDLVETLKTNQTCEKAANLDHQKKKVILTYISGLNYTERMAHLIADGIHEAEENIITKFYDLETESFEKIISDMEDADALLVGTPTIKKDAPAKVWDFLTAYSMKDRKMLKAAVFGSYQYTGEAVKNITQRLEQMGASIIDNGINIAYRLEENDCQTVYEYGYNIGCVVLGIANNHRSKLLKCLVCGEIFDSSLGVCPVCGVGPDQCVPVDEEIITYKADTDLLYVVIGGGGAAVSAAEAIRKRDGSGRIILISAEENYPMNRPMLTKNMIASALTPEKLEIKSRDWYEENCIELLLGERVKNIDTKSKKVETENENSFHYDRLVIATGAECFVPPIKGKEKSGVITIRHPKDVAKVWKLMATASNIVVIGGGVLGLEAASEFVKNRKNVTVLEMAPRLMANQLNEETSETVKEICKAAGVPVHTAVSIAEIEGVDSVTGVRLETGEVFPADIVVLSCGMRAQIDLAKEAGLETDRAIVVDEQMQTSAENVYACGDCAQFMGVNYQLWSEATEQGRVAGANAVGDHIVYKNKKLGMDFAGMNQEVYAIGEVGNQGKEYQIVENKDEIRQASETLWFVDGRICGAILVGNMSRMLEISDAVAVNKRYEDIV